MILVFLCGHFVFGCGLPRCVFASPRPSVKIVLRRYGYGFLTANHANHAKGPAFLRITPISRSPRFSIVLSELRPEIVDQKTLARNNLQITPPNRDRFWPENAGLLQKNQGPTEIILNFFSRFFCFWGFFPLQAVAFQPQAAIQPLQKKSCLKTDGRFSLRPGVCHNRRVNVETTGRNVSFRGARASRTRCLASRQTHLRPASPRAWQHPAYPDLQNAMWETAAKGRAGRAARRPGPPPRCCGAIKRSRSPIMKERCADPLKMLRDPRSVLERGTTVPLSDRPLESGALARALQNLSAFPVPIKANQT